jgi:lambda family phage tail tape measure protein
MAKNIDVVIQAVKNLALFLGPAYLIKALTLVAYAIRSNPIGLLLTAISAIIAIVPEFQDKFNAIVSTMQVLFKEVTGVEASFSGLFSFLEDALADVVLFFASSFESVLGTINGLYKAVTFLFDNLAAQPKAVGELIVYYLKKGFQEYGKLVVSFYKTLAETIFGIADDITSALKNMILAGTELLKGSLETAQTYSDNATSAFSRTANRVLNFGKTLENNRKAIDANKLLFPDIDQPGEDARKLGNQVAEQYAEGVSEYSGKITQAIKTAFYGEGFSVLTPAAQAGKAAADAFASSFQQQIGANNIGVGVLAPDVLDARAAERQRQAAFAPRGAMGLIPGDFQSPGSAGAPGGKADEYAKEIEQLQKALALDYERINTGQQAANILAKRLEFEAQGIELSGEQLALLKSLSTAAADYAAASQFAQQLDVAKQLIDQERQLNLLLAERPDLSRSIEDAMLSAKIAALETSTTLEAGFTRAFLKLQQEAQNLAAVGEQVVNVFADKMTDALTTFLQTGEFNFKQFATSILDEITKILVRLLVVQAISAAIGGPAAGPAATGLVSALGGGGGRAKGGTVQPDRSYLVGEQGPEIFQPRTTGTVVPNPASVQAAPPQVNVQVVNVDDPNSVPAAINKGGSDEAIINVLARNRDRVRQTIG